MRLSLLRFILFSSLLILSSCATIDLSDYEPGSFIVEGNIIYLDVEGGCWQLRTADGKSYEISSETLSDLFRENSYAEMVVHPIDDASSICMAGKLVEVLDIIHISSK
jgi:hypothetical protein